MKPFERIGLWFASILVAAAVFTVVMGVWGGGYLYAFFKTTIMFALPVGCLCIIFVAAFKDAHGPRLWIILATSVVIGPASLMLLGFIQQLRGVPPDEIWDPEIGRDFPLICASIVGLLTAAVYCTALRALSRRPTTPLA